MSHNFFGMSRNVSGMSAVVASRLSNRSRRVPARSSRELVKSTWGKVGGAVVSALAGARRGRPRRVTYGIVSDSIPRRHDGCGSTPRPVGATGHHAPRIACRPLRGSARGDGPGITAYSIALWASRPVAERTRHSIQALPHGSTPVEPEDSITSKPVAPLPRSSGSSPYTNSRRDSRACLRKPCRFRRIHASRPRGSLPAAPPPRRGARQRAVVPFCGGRRRDACA